MHTRPIEAVIARAEAPALVIDRGALRCFDAVIRDFTRIGCTVISRSAPEFPAEFGLQVADFDELIIARVLWQRDNCAGVTFEWDESALPDSRRETRVGVSIPATMSNLDGRRLVMCTIREASKSGCRIQTEHLRQIDNDVLINISTMKMAIRGRIVWREDPDAGISLMWNTARKAPGPRF